MDKERWAALRRRLSGKKTAWLLVAAGVLGMVLIALSGRNESAAADPPAQPSVREYTEQLEQRLAKVIEGIDGAGECRVMVTLENGVEYLYATEQKSDSSLAEKNSGTGSDRTQADTSQASVILVDTGNGKQGLLVTEIQPTVKGVVVVCRGGDQPAVQQRVTEAVTTVLHLSSARVCVTKLS